MRIGMVCPYSFDVHGGVQAHVLQLAEVMRERGHDVSVLAPSSPDAELPDYVVSGGKAVPIPYNGSVARLRFGPATHRLVKKWIAAGDFDVLHLHEPNAPSLSLLALMVAEGPIVATFHTSTTKSLALGVFQSLLRPYNEKIVGRIAVSDLARRWHGRGVGRQLARLDTAVHELPGARTTHASRPAKGEHPPAIAAAVRGRGEDDDIDHADRDLDVGRRDLRPCGT